MLFIFSRVLCEIPWGYTCTSIHKCLWRWTNIHTHTHHHANVHHTDVHTYICCLTSYRNAETFKWKIFCKFDDDENSCTFAAFRMYINTYIHACKRVCVCVCVACTCRLSSLQFVNLDSRRCCCRCNSDLATLCSNSCLLLFVLTLSSIAF